MFRVLGVYNFDFIQKETLEKEHGFNNNFTAPTINCVCHSIRSMFRVLGVYNFDYA